MRNIRILKDGDKCFRCGSIKNLIMHHIDYNPETLTPCCRSCHKKIHDKQPKNSPEENIISIKSASERTQFKNKPIEFDINSVRKNIDGLLEMSQPAPDRFELKVIR